MTAVWGPLGWMTLHSIATSYPESPTQTEKQLISVWLDMFRDTITCIHCKEHFTHMLELYRRKVPSMLNSRQELALFSFRAHNTVNRRLSKPVYNTVEECMATLRRNIQTRTPQEYRIAYLTHIQKYWRTLQDVSGLVALRKISEMKKIEKEYFSLHDTKFDVELQESMVIFPYGVLDEPPKGPRAIPVPVLQPTSSPQLNQPRSVPITGFRITAGGLRLR